MTRHTIPDHWTPVQAATWRTVHEYWRHMQVGLECLQRLDSLAEE